MHEEKGYSHCVISHMGSLAIKSTLGVLHTQQSQYSPGDPKEMVDAVSPNKDETLEHNAHNSDSVIA